MTEVQKAAGILSWISCAVRHIKPFNGCLWGAIVEHSRTIEQRIAATSAKKRPTHLVFVQQISHAINTGTRPALKERPEARWFAPTPPHLFGMGVVLFQRGHRHGWKWNKREDIQFGRPTGSYSPCLP